MPNSAVVNYHITSPEPQAFHIDADGEAGKLVSPELVPASISVSDVRGDDVSVDFSDDSLAFVRHASAIRDFDDRREWVGAYERELGDLLKEQIAAKEVVVFDHTVRIDDLSSGRKPARNVHSDYSPKGAHQRLRDLLGAERAEAWEASHFAFVNAWRPVGHSINSAPLGFVRPNSVSPQDWITIDLVYPDRTGQIMGLARNDDHDWFYRSRMTPDDIAIFNIYDNRGRPSIAHSALDLIENNSVQVKRMSIESRTLVRY
ncbi:MAG: CmcJ/NvfI family oxidoreductase [Geminicoccaceae bacterium]